MIFFDLAIVDWIKGRRRYLARVQEGAVNSGNGARSRTNEITAALADFSGLGGQHAAQGFSPDAPPSRFPRTLRCVSAIYYYVMCVIKQGFTRFEKIMANKFKINCYLVSTKKGQTFAEREFFPT